MSSVASWDTILGIGLGTTQVPRTPRSFDPTTTTHSLAATGAATVMYLWTKGSSDSSAKLDEIRQQKRREQKFTEDELKRYTGEGERLCFVSLHDGRVVDVTSDKSKYLSVGGTRLSPEKSLEVEKELHNQVGTLIIPREFDVDELWEYNGTDGKPIYLAAKGVVYDVSSGDDFYGPESGYNIMAGRDASRALATMSLDIKDVDKNNIDDLSYGDIFTLDEWIAKYQFKYYVVGTLKGWTPEKGSPMPSKLASSSAARAAPAPTFLTKKRQKVPLKEKIRLSHDTWIFRFGLPDPKMRLGLPIGKHIKFWCPNPKPVVAGEWNGRPSNEDGKAEIERKYTPSSLDVDCAGFFDIVIKVYEPNEKFVDGGKMSQHIGRMKIGDTIDVAGPYGLIEYKGNGQFYLKKQIVPYSYVGMMAGGTGVTPMLQLIKAILRNPMDKTKISLLFANQTEDDILVRNMLEELQEKHSDRFKLWYTLDRPPTDWQYSQGFIGPEMVKDHLPPPSPGTVILMCGPPPMIKFACKPALEKLGYEKKQCLDF